MGERGMQGEPGGGIVVLDVNVLHETANRERSIPHHTGELDHGVGRRDMVGVVYAGTAWIPREILAAIGFGTRPVSDSITIDALLICDRRSNESLARAVTS